MNPDGYEMAYDYPEFPKVFFYFKNLSMGCLTVIPGYFFTLNSKFLN